MGGYSINMPFNAQNNQGLLAFCNLGTYNIIIRCTNQIYRSRTCGKDIFVKTNVERGWR